MGKESQWDEFLGQHENLKNKYIENNGIGKPEIWSQQQDSVRIYFITGRELWSDYKIRDDTIRMK